MLDWFGDSGEGWNRKAIHILNSLVQQGREKINENKSRPLMKGDDVKYNFWICKELYFFYNDQEYRLSDYRLSKASEEPVPSVSAVGVNSEAEFISILDDL